ncbi:(2Fe-2S)-binding protein [Luteimonas wenzhouensis]|uniref:Bacterioferritin-associated ferredoxin n=1 Tax=Luteimonas wenzhouensis TaxID=2599615 RepID=A0A5C5TZW5_9GAMM|nr:(2Fe-2S)-binding protein [Luteimonas wenzhouensis]NLW97554.1 bacterioferritin [Xanthomonadaceae bacterium]TWT18852.1 bacterioferritin [Luteimonas wenzhouensis]
MYVCICNGITDQDIRAAAEAGCSSLPELTMRTGVGACCGTCIETAGALLEACRPSSPPAATTALVVLSRAA